jgi:hypothetical protein
MNFVFMKIYLLVQIILEIHHYDNHSCTHDIITIIHVFVFVNNLLTMLTVYDIIVNSSSAYAHIHL